eukprot:832374-Amphidinium_carterae.1
MSTCLHTRAWMGPWVILFWGCSSRTLITSSSILGQMGINFVTAEQVWGQCKEEKTPVRACQV